ncbi:hypothetical protein [Salinispira pacifica]|uniref:Uncharacterized protein n=1 Tax=Salinispira pacifica TaxID=1307761 RepID=V5WDL2_9SPIO|nr:hypothetical protein [Salinispira pacifica]AHC13872.1 hypothetical protein L21SP2_0440 [Salinispira pacifica]
MSGLLAKARDIRRKRGLSVPVHQEGSDSSQGISQEELEGINRKINEVASANRIDVRPDTFQLQSTKRGIGLPLMVNFLSLLVLAAGLAVMFYFFRQNESNIEREVQTLSSTEGRLLEVLREEAEANLAAKEAEIAEIQNRLQQVETERSNLARNFDERLAAREQLLREELESELEAERERLRAQGLSEEEIQQRIAQIREEKEAELSQALASFQTELEEERAQAEAALAQIEDEYSSELAAADQARAELQAEARAREEALQAQLDAAREEQQQELDEASREVSEARSALEELNARQEEEQALASQLNGFYSRIRTQISNDNYEQAQNTIELLRNFLSTPAFLETESLSRRRDTELFLADSLSRLITSNQRRNTESTSLARTAELVGEIQAIYGQAAQLQNRGEGEQALELYREAVNLIPEISRSYQALEQADERQDQAALENAVEAAEESGEQQALARAEEEYQVQLAELETRLNQQIQEQTDTIIGLQDQIQSRQLTIDQRDQTIEDLRQELESANARISRQSQELTRLRSGVEDLEGARENLDAETEDLLAQIDSLQQELETRRGNEQNLEEQIALLNSRLQGSEADAAGSAQELEEGMAELESTRSRLSELEDQISELENRLSSREDELAQTGLALQRAEQARAQAETAQQNALDALRELQARETAEPTAGETAPELRQELENNRAELAARESRISELETELTRLERQIARESNRISSLDTQVTNLEEENDRLERELEVTETSSQRLNAETRARIASLQEQVEQLAAVAEDYSSMISAYERYVRAEEQLAAGVEDRAILQGKIALDRFLSAPEVQDAFPGLSQRIKRYDRAFEAAGKEAVILELADEIYAVSSYPPGARREYISQQMEQTDNPDMLDFYENMLLILDQ